MPSEGYLITVDHDRVRLVALLVGISRGGFILSFVSAVRESRQGQRGQRAPKGRFRGVR